MTAARSEFRNPDLFETEPVAPVRPRRAASPWERANNVGIEIRMRDTPLGAEQFKGLLRQLEGICRRRLPEAVLERALRRFAVSHQHEIATAATRQRWRGRQVVEEDVIDVLERAFRTRRADPGLPPELARELSNDGDADTDLDVAPEELALLHEQRRLARRQRALDALADKRRTEAKARERRPEPESAQESTPGEPEPGDTQL